MGRIGLLTNRNASRNKKEPERSNRFQSILGNAGIVRETKDIEEISAVAKEFLKEEVDLLCVSGGDGTLHHVLTAFLNTYGAKTLPPIFPLRGGMMNTIANNIRIPKHSPENLLETLVEKYNKKQSFITHDATSIEVDGSGFGFIFGAGLVYNFLAAYYNGKSMGPTKAVEVITMGILSAIVRSEYAKNLFKPLKANLFVNGSESPVTEFTGILASSVEEVGLGFRMAHRANERPGYFHLRAVHAKTYEIILRVPWLYLGKEVRGNGWRSDLTDEIRLRSNDPIPYFIDGELYTAHGGLAVKIGPRITFVKE